MAAFEHSNEDRTESPSQHRREEFRRQGTVALSREVLSVVVLISVGMSLYIACSIILREFTVLSRIFFDVSHPSPIGKERVIDLSREVFRSWGWMVSPVFGVAFVASIIACLAQVGFYISWEPLSPKWERLNPAEGFSRLFSAHSGVEALKSVIKLAIAVWVVWIFLRSHVVEAEFLFEKSVPELAFVTLSLTGKLFFSLVLSLGVVAVADYAFQRFRTEKQMKMTRREAKDEFKLREGDPLIKSRIRSIQRRMASRRMMDAVPKADVIVTNPTHLAVALKYDPSQMAAPKVVAKGAGVIAQKIRELARFNRVPIVENKPLARTLFKEIEIGQFIPKELYKAVAEVLAYVYRLRGKYSVG